MIGMFFFPLLFFFLRGRSIGASGLLLLPVGVLLGFSFFSLRGLAPSVYPILSTAFYEFGRYERREC